MGLEHLLIRKVHIGQMGLADFEGVNGGLECKRTGKKDRCLSLGHGLELCGGNGMSHAWHMLGHCVVTVRLLYLLASSSNPGRTAYALVPATQCARFPSCEVTQKFSHGRDLEEKRAEVINTTEEGRALWTNLRLEMNCRWWLTRADVMLSKCLAPDCSVLRVRK